MGCEHRGFERERERETFICRRVRERGYDGYGGGYSGYDGGYSGYDGGYSGYGGGYSGYGGGYSGYGGGYSGYGRGCSGSSGYGGMHHRRKDCGCGKRF